MQKILVGFKSKALYKRFAGLLEKLNPMVVRNLESSTDRTVEEFDNASIYMVVTSHDWFEKNPDTAWIQNMKGGRNPLYWTVVGPNDAREAVRWMRMGADQYIPEDMEDEAIVTALRASLEEPPVSPPLLGRKDIVLLQIIREISQSLNDLETLMNLSMDASMEISRADYGSFLIYQEGIEALEVQQQRGHSEPVEATWGLMGFSQQQLIQWLQAGAQVVLPKRENYIHAAEDPMPDVRSAVIAPIIDHDHPVGVIMLVHTLATRTLFSRLELDIIQTFVHDLAPVIHNAIRHAHAQELNFKDDLTDAYNRRYFEQFLPEEISRSERFGANLSIIFLDLDNLKRINERFGHLMGSKSLQEVTHRMILAVRGSDHVVRYGGDEFCVILPETDAKGACQVAERIRTEIASRPFLTAEGLEIPITASFGIASFPAHGRTKDGLVQAADRAMYSVKMSTKDAIKIAEPLIDTQRTDDEHEDAPCPTSKMD